MTNRKNPSSIQDTLKAIMGAQRIILCAHLQPDGDTIGSLLAMKALLERLGKEVTAICHDPVPKNLHILNGWEAVQLASECAIGQFDLFCALDCSNSDRLGDALTLFNKAPLKMVIDHHASNTFYGDINYVDSKVAATGNLVFRLYEAAEMEIPIEVTPYLYAALSSDTGNFAFGQMDEEFFVQISKLLKAGLDITRYSRALHLMKEVDFVKLLSRALASLSFICDGKISYMCLTQQDFKESETAPESAEGLVNYALNLPGVQMCFLATETRENRVKFNLRAIQPHNVAEIATHFGGGGHVLAAGCTLEMPFEKAVSLMKERMSQSVC